MVHTRTDTDRDRKKKRNKLLAENETNTLIIIIISGSIVKAQRGLALCPARYVMWHEAR